jgi:cytidine deaminase
LNFSKALSLDAADLELIEAARAVLLAHYRPFWHSVSAALRGADGRIWTGIHLGATVGRLSICAEAIAMGRAILEGDGRVITAVAMRHPKPEESDQEFAIVSPCGACRELLTDHAPAALVILADRQKWPLSTLLPFPYQR